MNAPKLASDLPLYPPTQQLLRVTSTTIAGPAGGASAGLGTGNIAPTVLYVASTQQMRTDTLAPRDREPCLVTEPNGRTLTAGYYHGRLSGNYNGLPVYSVIMDASSGGGGSDSAEPYLPWEWMTDEQRTLLEANLNQTQLNILNNLNACQLQVLLQLTISQIQILTTNLTATQITYFLDRLNYTQIINLINTLNITQITTATSAYPNLYELIHFSLTLTQVTTLLTNLTSHQISTLISLTSTQLQTIIQLTVPQLQLLTSLTPTQVTTLVGYLSVTQITNILNTLTLQQLQQLTNNYNQKQIEQLSASVQPEHFANVVTQPPTQANKLLSLNAAQLSVVSQLSPTSLNTLTSNLNTTEIANFVDTLTFTQLNTLVNNLSAAQVVTASSAYPQLFQLLNQSLTTSQVNTLLTSLTSQQVSVLVNLTSAQLQVVVQLTTPHIQILTNLTAPQVTTLIGQLTVTQITSLLTVLTVQQLQQLTNNYTSNQIQHLIQSGVAVTYFTNIVNLTVTQINVLLSLDNSQLQTITQLTQPQIQQLVINLSTTQLATIIDTLTFTQLVSLATTLSTSQVVVAASAYPQTYQLLNQSLTTTQVNSILSNLTSQQFSTLVSLTAPQLVVVANLTTLQLQTLTSLTSQQVNILVGQNTTVQLASILNVFTHSQLQQLTNTLTSCCDIEKLILTLTVVQIQTLVVNLTPTQLRNLVTYDSATIFLIVNKFSLDTIISILNRSPLTPAPISGGQSLFPYLPTIVGQPSSVPNPTLGGYSPVVVDNTGKVWSYINGLWKNLSSPSNVLRWEVIEIDYTDVQDPLTTKTIEFRPWLAGEYIQYGLVYQIEQFTSTSGTPSMDVGINGTPNFWVTGWLTSNAVDSYDDFSNVPNFKTLDSNTNFEVSFNNGVDPLDDLTAGRFRIYLLMSTLPTP